MNDIWQAVIQLILLPISIVGVLAFVMREFFKSYLSKDVERYKTELQTDLETYKAKLKAEYDLKHFEFQTRFSLLHQKRAEAIESLYASLASVEMDLQILTYWVDSSRRGTKEEFYIRTTKDLDCLCDYFDKKRIYFDEEIAGKTIAIAGFATTLKSGLSFDDSFSSSYPEITGSLKEQADRILGQNIRPLMSQLEKKFKRMLSAENTDNRLEQIK